MPDAFSRRVSRLRCEFFIDQTTLSSKARTGLPDTPKLASTFPPLRSELICHMRRHCPRNLSPREMLTLTYVFPIKHRAPHSVSRQTISRGRFPDSGRSTLAQLIGIPLEDLGYRRRDQGSGLRSSEPQPSPDQY